MISISNIAWPNELEEGALSLLKANNVSFIDIAPSKYFSDIATVSDAAIEAVRARLADNGFTAVGMQSLLYGTVGLNVFGDKGGQAKMLAHLQKVAHIGALLGATKLVFGSPHNRDCSLVPKEQVMPTALAFFDRLGDIAKQEGVVFCIEPNPTCYGTNFLTTTLEAFEFVKELNHFAIRMQLDTGTILTNDEPFELIETVKDWVGHIHISQPNLSPISEDWPHEALASHVSRLPGIKTIEMQGGEEPFVNIQKALSIVKKFYGN